MEQERSGKKKNEKIADRVAAVAVNLRAARLRRDEGAGDWWWGTEAEGRIMAGKIIFLKNCSGGL